MLQINNNSNNDINNSNHMNTNKKTGINLMVALAKRFCNNEISEDALFQERDNMLREQGLMFFLLIVFLLSKVCKTTNKQL